MDLMLDEDAFQQASKNLNDEREKLKDLQSNIKKSFEQLKQDWKSDAGNQFFSRFENDLIVNLNKYAAVFEYMSQNLLTASQKYEEVFRAADIVSNTQY